MTNRLDNGQEDSLILNCSITGHPVTSILWKKDGQPLKGTEYKFMDKNILQIAPLSSGQRGIYQCLVFNDYQMIQASIQVIPKGKYTAIH